MTNENSKPAVIVTTSAFPRWIGEERDMFIFNLVKALSNDFRIIVIAPRDKYCPQSETFGEITIFRHHQFPYNWLQIAYGSGIMTNIKSNILLLFALPFYFIFQILAIKKIQKRSKAKLIYCHWLIPQGLAGVLFKVLFNKNIKLLCTIHGSDLLGFNSKLGRRIKKTILKHIDQVTVVSNYLRSEVLKTGYLKEVLVYPMGIDTNQFHPSKYNLLLKKQYNPNGPIILFTGSIIYTKGISYLIEAMPDILKEIPNTKLLIAGHGVMQTNLEKRVRTLLIENEVVFLGQIPHDKLPGYFATADVFILPSLSEGLGLVIAESMSSGAITITTELPAIYDLVEPQQTGFMIKSQSQEDISKQIIFVLKNISTFKELRSNARKHIQKNFDITMTVNNYKKLIDRMIV